CRIRLRTSASRASGAAGLLGLLAVGTSCLPGFFRLAMLPPCETGRGQGNGARNVSQWHDPAGRRRVPGSRGCPNETTFSGRKGPRKHAAPSPPVSPAESGTLSAYRTWDTSHTLTVVSSLPEARVLPSGLNATDRTAPLCPLRQSSWA